MHVLHAVRCKVEDVGVDKELHVGPWHTLLLESIFLLPALESLDIDASWTSTTEAFSSQAFSLRYANLRHFSYGAPFFHSRTAIRTEGCSKRGPEQINVEIQQFAAHPQL